MRKSRKLAVVAGVVALMMIAGVALAAWVATGSGNGYAKAKTAAPLTTVDVSSSTVGQLYPGGSGDLKISIANPNDYPVLVTDVTGSGGIVTTDSTGTCDASTGVTFTNQTGLSLAVPAHSAGTPFTLGGVVHMSNASDDSCQGKTFDVPVSLAGHSNA